MGGATRRPALLLLLILVAAVAALLLYGGMAAAQSGTTDYDSDNDGLIEVASLAQLNALRWDLDGDGAAADAGYAAAFPSPAVSMGCLNASCTGYELAANLNFDSDGDGDVDAADAFGGNWQPIGDNANRYRAVFDGNDRTISNLRIDRSGTDHVGLFGVTDTGSVVRNVDLVNVDVTGQDDVGALAGTVYGQVDRASSTGSVNGHGSHSIRASSGGLIGNLNSTGTVRRSHSAVSVAGRGGGAGTSGGLVGVVSGRVETSYATGAVSSATTVGGLVGYVSGGRVTRSYATGRATATGANAGGLVGVMAGVGTIEATYATGAVSGSSSAGGLVGDVNSGHITNSYSTGRVTGNGGGAAGTQAHGDDNACYWDTETSARATSVRCVGQTTAELQTPTDTTSDMDGSTPGVQNIYSAWSDANWDFGTNMQYPVLKVDFNDDGNAGAAEFGRQWPVDYDADNDGLIEVDNLAKLNALRWDLDGDGGDYTDPAYTDDAAFYNPAADMGCPGGCMGYELTADLDFDTNGNSRADAYWNGGAGWEPIGPFVTKLDGNNHTIANLYINRSAEGVGLFGRLASANRGANRGEIRRVRLTDVDVTNSGRYTGALVGRVEKSKVIACSATGVVAGTGYAGGLVGSMGVNSGVVADSFAAVRVTGESYVGGLVGGSVAGSIRTSYATGAVSGSAAAGGLVGRNGGLLENSYATGSVIGFSAGALAGFNIGPVLNSYATGRVSGTDGSGRLLGGLWGDNTVLHDDKAPVIGTKVNSYWDVDTTGQSETLTHTYLVTPYRIGYAFSADGGKTTAELQTPTSSAPGIFSSWSLDVWDLGTNMQYPVLKRDLDGDGAASAYEFGGQGRAMPTDMDYDTDNNRLIEVASLVQLNAIRWDLDGDGAAADAGYAVAFPNPVAGMGCSGGCNGYELTASLDFDQNDDGVITGADPAWWNGGAGWEPLGGNINPGTDISGNKFSGVFEGNHHTIANLFINRSGRKAVGLFGGTGWNASIRNLNLTDANVTGRERVGALVGYSEGSVATSSASGEVTATDQNVGGMVGLLGGRITGSYASVTVSGGRQVGGLVGYVYDTGSIAGSYATGSVTSSGGDTGGLVGLQHGIVRASYATGSVTATGTAGGLTGALQGSVEASYSTGRVQSGGSNVGGLVGLIRGAGAVTNGYWDTNTSSQPNSAAGMGKTTAQLQTPTGYNGIYSGWNLNLDSAPAADDPWDFGTNAEYPALKSDFDGNGAATVAEFGNQPRSGAPVDYDGDGDGLIGVASLIQLNAIRWDLDGDGAAADAGYAVAFPNPVAGMGCSGGCNGYELTASLDFDQNDDGVITGADPAWWNGGAGWEPLGGNINPGSDIGVNKFGGVFEGNDHTIANLLINRPGHKAVGLFGGTGWNASIRNLNLTGAVVRGQERVGALVGYSEGSVATSSASGEVTATGQNVGGMVGLLGGSITGSYASVTVSGGRRVGGLVGYLHDTASIAGSYATGTVNGAFEVGGLVGHSRPNSQVSRSFATGSVTSSGGDTGGLVGLQHGIVRASYATGGSVTAAGTAGGLSGALRGSVDASYSTGQVSGGSNVGGLVGLIRGAGAVTNSYWDTGTSSQPNSAGGTGKTTSQLQMPTGYNGIYSGWNLNLDSDPADDDPWDFGTNAQYPALKSDSDGDGTATAAEFGSQRSMRSARSTRAAESAPPGQPVAPVFINVAGTSFRITWTAPAAGSSAISGYGIQYKLASEADSAYAHVNPTPTGTVTGYNLVNRNGQAITAGTSYHVRVRAQNAEGWGEWSEAATVLTAVAAQTAPGQPAAPVFINVAGTSFRITWTAPAAGSSAISGYGIQYKLASEADSAYAHVNPTPTGTVTGYNLVNRNGQTIAAGTSYHVRVRAQNAEGWGQWSEAATVTTAD